MPRPLSPEIEQQNRRIRALIAQMSHAEAGESLDSLVKELGEAKRRLAEMMRTESPVVGPVARGGEEAGGRDARARDDRSAGRHRRTSSSSPSRPAFITCSTPRRIRS